MNLATRSGAEVTYSEHSGIIIIADMGDMYWILRCGDVDSTWRPNQAVHETREASLLPRYRTFRLLRLI